MRFGICLLLLPVACGTDETVAGYGAAGRVWAVQEIDGAPFPAHATLTFAAPGRIAGDTPCNRYTGTMTAPYPWFRAEQVAATRLVCPELAAEARFLDALMVMSLSEVLGPVMILRDESGREIVLRAQ